MLAYFIPVIFILYLTLLAHYLHCGFLLPQFFSRGDVHSRLPFAISGDMFNYHGYRVWKRLQTSWVQDGAADLQHLGWFPIAKNYVIQIPRAPRLITQATQPYKSVTRIPRLLLIQIDCFKF